MRYPPIPRAEWTAEQQAVADAITAGPRGELRGPFVPLLHAPDIASKVQELGEVIRFKTGIPDALLEIAVLMTARRRDCPNIWESHSRLARKAGVSPGVISAIAERRAPDGLDADALGVLQLCRELLDDNRVSDETFAHMQSRWGRRGVMELVAICGYYGLLAGILNVAQRPLEPGSVPFGVPG